MTQPLELLSKCDNEMGDLLRDVLPLPPCHFENVEFGVEQRESEGLGSVKHSAGDDNNVVQFTIQTSRPFHNSLIVYVLLMF